MIYRRTSWPVETVFRARSGMTLIEIMLVVGLIGVLSAVGVVGLEDWFENQRVRGAAHAGADIIQLARAEAIRTGHNYLVFFGPPGTTDPAGTAIQDGGGNWVPVLVVDDGPPETSNCRIDGGEPRRGLEPEQDVTWGVTAASVVVPDDQGGASFVPPQASGATFTDPDGNATNWLMFRPDGIPVAFSYSAGACDDIANTGSGGGGLYITNGRRDYSIVLSPLGTVRVHFWTQGGSWSG